MAGALTAGGSLVGYVVPADIRRVVAAALLGSLTIVELIGRADRLPQNRRVVPQTIVIADGVAGPLQFGFEMGTGLRTFATSALPWAVVVMVLLWTPDAVEGLAVGVGFGTGRSLVLPARRGDPERWDRRMSESRRPIALVLMTAFAVIATGLLLG